MYIVTMQTLVLQPILALHTKMRFRVSISCRLAMVISATGSVLDCENEHRCPLCKTSALWSTYPCALHLHPYLESCRLKQHASVPYSWWPLSMYYAHDLKAHINRRGQQKHSVCDARGPWQLVWSIMKPAFNGFVVLKMLRSPGLAISMLINIQINR